MKTSFSTRQTGTLDLKYNITFKLLVFVTTLIVYFCLSILRLHVFTGICTELTFVRSICHDEHNRRCTCSVSQHQCRLIADPPHERTIGVKVGREKF